MKKYGNKLSQMLGKDLRLRDSPKSIANGFQLIVSLGIAAILKINKKSACVAVFDTNMATGVFLFAFNYCLGEKIPGIQNDFQLPERTVSISSKVFKSRD